MVEDREELEDQVAEKEDVERLVPDSVGSPLRELANWYDILLMEVPEASDAIASIESFEERKDVVEIFVKNKKVSHNDQTMLKALVLA